MKIGRDRKLSETDRVCEYDDMIYIYLFIYIHKYIYYMYMICICKLSRIIWMDQVQ